MFHFISAFPFITTEDVPLDFEVALTLDSEEIQIGDIISVETEAYGTQPGRVETICDSPFYGQTGLMAFVVSLENEPFWTTYIPVEVNAS